MLRVFTDIESLPPPEEMRQQLSGVKVRKLLRKHSQKEADEEIECTDEEFRQLALHAEYGRVLTIGVIMEQDGRIMHQGVLGRNRSDLQLHCNEARTLRGFWKLLNDFNVHRDLLVGHNVFWDLKFLRKRSLINRIKPTIEIPFTRFRSQPIYDTMQEWCAWDYQQYISLEHLAEVLKLDMSKTQGIDGSKVYDCWCQQRHDLICEYVMRDVEMARAIYYRLTNPEGPELQGEVIRLPDSRIIAV